MTAFMSERVSFSDTPAPLMTLDQAKAIILGSHVDTNPEAFEPSALQRRAVHTILNAGAEYGPGVFGFGPDAVVPSFDIEESFAKLNADQAVIVALINQFEFELMRSIALRFRSVRAAA
ncbi:hypothetical protein [Martelella mediterranea]|uniref:Uncharacterized protein n=1 Tax=Martelella mediterranea TaxID=293089 RepID=A0A4R3NPA3_9HYPH|nr:hypothetical protein [Martelella mediterranea]TCT37464.1 hypothetical protein EDC90_101841 [Martelella mediterranea]